MDVEMPDGTIIEGVPEGITKAELTQRLSKYRTSAPQPAAPPAPEEETGGFGNAFLSGFATPVQAIGRTARALGAETIGGALESVPTPKGYVSAGERLTNPKEGDFTIGGIAPAYLPRAAVEQVGQLAGSIASRGAGAAIGGALGGPGGAAIGAIAGPTGFGGLQVLGDAAFLRAKNNNREKPNYEDLLGAVGTAVSSGLIDAFSAKLITGAAGPILKRVASGAASEGGTEFAQSIIEQFGGSAGTEKGLDISGKQAVAEGLIGAITGGGASALLGQGIPQKVTEEEAPSEPLGGIVGDDIVDPRLPVGSAFGIIDEQDNKRVITIDSVKDVDGVPIAQFTYHDEADPTVRAGGGSSELEDLLPNLFDTDVAPLTTAPIDEENTQKPEPFDIQSMADQRTAEIRSERKKSKPVEPGTMLDVTGLDNVRALRESAKEHEDEALNITKRRNVTPENQFYVDNLKALAVQKREEADRLEQTSGYKPVEVTEEEGAAARNAAKPPPMEYVEPKGLLDTEAKTGQGAPQVTVAPLKYEPLTPVGDLPKAVRVKSLYGYLIDQGGINPRLGFVEDVGGAGAFKGLLRGNGISVREAVNRAEKAGYLGPIKEIGPEEANTKEDMNAFATALSNAKRTFPNDAPDGGVNPRKVELERRAELKSIFGNAGFKGEDVETIQHREDLHTSFGVPIEETKKLNIYQLKERRKELWEQREAQRVLSESQRLRKKAEEQRAADNAKSEKKTLEEDEAKERAAIQALEELPKQERFVKTIEAPKPTEMTIEEKEAEADRIFAETQFKIPQQPTAGAGQPRKYADALTTVELNDLQKRLKKFDPKGRIALRLREKIEALVNGNLEEADGQYLRNLIEVSLQAGDKVGVLNHEVIHALKDLGLFTPQEWSVLTKTAIEDKALMDNVRSRYEGVKGMTEAKLVEEAVADLHARWQDGKYKIGGIIRSALERISSFIKSFGNALRGSGFSSDPTVGSIFKDVSKGTIGERDVRRAADPFGIYTEIENPTGVFSLSEGQKPKPLLNPDGTEQTAAQVSNTVNKVNRVTGGSPKLASDTISRPVLFFAMMQGVARKFPVIAAYQRFLQARSERETALIKEGEKPIERMAQLDYKRRKQNEAVMEFARLTNTNITPTRNGRITVVLPENYNGVLGRPGEVFMLDKEQTEIFMGIKDYFKARWNQYGQAIGKRWGYEGEWDAKAIQAAIADAQNQGDPRRAKNLEFVNAIYNDAKARENYVPFSRAGDEGFKVVNKLTGEVMYFEMVNTKNVWGGLTGSSVKKNEIITSKFAELQKKFSELDANGERLYAVKNDPIIEEDIKSLDVSLIEKLLAATNIADKKDRNSAMNNILEALQGTGLGKTDVKNALRDSLLDQVKKAQRAGFTKESRNVPGYSTDFLQSIIDYNRASASVVSGVEYGQQTEDAYERTQDGRNVPENIRKYAERVNNYLDSDEKLIGQLKQYGFWSSLWGSASSALVNLSQTPTITATQIAGWAGIPAAGRTIKLSMNMLRALSFDRRKGINLDPNKIKFNSPEEQVAFMDAFNRGRINPTVTQDLHGTSPDNWQSISKKIGNDKSAKIQRVIWNIFDVGTSAFNGAEQVNRATAWLAAYREAQAPGAIAKFKNMYANDARVSLIENQFGLTPANIADFFVNETQFIGGKIDRPEALRGIGGVAFQFKQYPMNYLRILKNNMTSAGPEGKIAGTMMLMALTAFGGLLGLPFADDIIESYEFIKKNLTGIDPMIEYEMRELLEGIGASPEWAEAAARGPARFLGIDVSKRIGQGQILPDANPIMNIPIFSATIGKVIEAKKRFDSDQPIGGALALASIAVPKGPADIARGLVQFPTEGYRTQSGDMKVAEPNIGQRAAKAAGFQPTKFSSIQERDYFARRLKYRTKEAEDMLSTNLSAKLANSISAREKGDSQKADKLMKEFVDKYQRAAVDFGNPSVPLDEKVQPPSISSIKNRALVMMHPELAVRNARKLKRPALYDLYNEEEG